MKLTINPFFWIILDIVYIRYFDENFLKINSDVKELKKKVFFLI